MSLYESTVHFLEIFLVKSDNSSLDKPFWLDVGKTCLSRRSGGEQVARNNIEV